MRIATHNFNIVLSVDIRLPLLILFSVMRVHHVYGGEHGGGRCDTAFCI